MGVLTITSTAPYECLVTKFLTALASAVSRCASAMATLCIWPDIIAFTKGSSRLYGLSLRLRGRTQPPGFRWTEMCPRVESSVLGSPATAHSGAHRVEACEAWLAAVLGDVSSANMVAERHGTLGGTVG